MNYKMLKLAAEKAVAAPDRPQLNYALAKLREALDHRSPVPKAERPQNGGLLACPHCVREAMELGGQIDPRRHSHMSFSLTETGFQVWCEKHDHHIVTADLLGAKLLLDEGSNREMLRARAEAKLSSLIPAELLAALFGSKFRG